MDLMLEIRTYWSLLPIICKKREVLSEISSPFLVSSEISSIVISLIDNALAKESIGERGRVPRPGADLLQLISIFA